MFDSEDEDRFKDLIPPSKPDISEQFKILKKLDKPSIELISNDKIMENTFMQMIYYEMKKGAEIDNYIDSIEDLINSPDYIESLDTKTLMRWYELMNTRKNHTRKFLMTFYESASKNDIIGKIFTNMTGKKVNNEELKQDDDTIRAKTILQKLMIDMSQGQELVENAKAEGEKELSEVDSDTEDDQDEL